MWREDRGGLKYSGVCRGVNGVEVVRGLPSLARHNLVGYAMRLIYLASLGAEIWHLRILHHCAFDAIGELPK